MVHTPLFEEVFGLSGDELAAAVRRDFFRYAFVGKEKAEGGDEALGATVGGAWLRSGDAGPARQPVTM